MSSASILLILHLFQGIDSSSADEQLKTRSQFSTGFDSATAVCTCPSTRSVLDIVWSCVVTIIACSWVSVHPDIPGPEELWWRVAFRRLEHMMWAIVAPEILLWWAARQWLGARSIAREQTEKRWTTTHGHFLQMGGFMLYEGDQQRGTLSYGRFKSLLASGRIDFPKITRKEIEDRSKSDVLSKLLVMGQVLWFILQCISRVVESLPITELELSTLALAALNGCMYFFWWYKPFGVQVPVPVQLLSKNRENIAVDDDLIPYEVPTRKLQKIARVMSWSPTPSRAIEDIRATALVMAGDNSASKIQFDDPRLPLEIREEQMQVPKFYALITSDEENLTLIKTLPTIGSLFGGIHCLGWLFSFPTTAERFIWRCCSLYITGLPTVVQICGIYFATGFDEHKGPINTILRPTVYITIGVFVGIIGLPLYVLARFLLLAESLVTLRDLPLRAFAVVIWTSFFPHI